MWDLTNVGYVERITVGSTDPEHLTPEAAIQDAADLLNRMLTGSPKGRIIGVEKNFHLLNIGEHQVVLQALVYHVGFERQPFWLQEEKRRRAEESVAATAAAVSIDADD